MPQPPYPRDMTGYGPTPPHADWPGGARIAVQLVLNYEEGGEMNVLHGDAQSETFLSDLINPAPVVGGRTSKARAGRERGPHSLY